MVYYSELFESIRSSLVDNLPDLSSKQLNLIAQNLIEDLEGTVLDVYYDIEDVSSTSENEDDL